MTPALLRGIPGRLLNLEGRGVSYQIVGILFGYRRGFHLPASEPALARPMPLGIHRTAWRRSQTRATSSIAG